MPAYSICPAIEVGAQLLVASVFQVDVLNDAGQAPCLLHKYVILRTVVSNELNLKNLIDACYVQYSSERIL